MTKEISMSEYSMGGDDEINSKHVEANFSLNLEGTDAFKKEDVRLQSEVSKSQLSIDMTDANPMEEDHLINEEIINNSAEQNSDSLI